MTLFCRSIGGETLLVCCAIPPCAAMGQPSKKQRLNTEPSYEWVQAIPGATTLKRHPFSLAEDNIYPARSNIQHKDLLVLQLLGITRPVNLSFNVGQGRAIVVNLGRVNLMVKNPTCHEHVIDYRQTMLSLGCLIFWEPVNGT